MPVVLCFCECVSLYGSARIPPTPLLFFLSMLCKCWGSVLFVFELNCNEIELNPIEIMYDHLCSCHLFVCLRVFVTVWQCLYSRAPLPFSILLLYKCRVLCVLNEMLTVRGS